MSDVNIRVAMPKKLKPLREPRRYKIMYGGRGGGKCLLKGTSVLLATGKLINVEEVRVGDMIMGINGSRKVLSTTSGVSEMFEVKQTSGENYTTNGNHILSLKKSDAAIRERRYNDHPLIVNISVDEWLTKSQRWKDNFRGYKVGWNTPNVDLKLDPYFLGLWIGDGSKDGATITSMDDEVIEYCNQIAEQYDTSVSLYQKKGQRAFTIKFPFHKRGHGKYNPITNKLREYNLLHNKHIPHEYITSSENDRLELLAGLIDSDGYYNQKNYQFSQKDEGVSRSFKLVADSLGFRTSIRNKMTTCDGKSFKSFIVTVGGDLWRIPCKIERKKSTNLKKNKDWKLSMIDIEPVGKGEYYGFELDGDHLFLLGDGTVTHNSHSVAIQLLIDGLEAPLRVLCAREVQKSIKQSVHQLLSDYIKSMNMGWFYQVLDQEIRGKNGTTFSFAGLATTTVDSIKSFEGADRVWVEEGQTVTKRSWDILIPTIRKPGSEIWVTFNPFVDLDNTYVRFVVNPPEEAWVVKVNYSDNPWFPEVLEKERLHCERVDPDNYRNIWLGECLSASEMQYITTDSVREAMSRTPLYLGDDALICGVDLARGGNDDCFFVFRRGKDAKSEKVYKISGSKSRNSMKVVSLLAKVLADHQPDQVNIDEGGLGGPIVDRMTQLGWNVMGVNFGGKADDDRHYSNKVAEMWSRMRTWIINGGALRNDERLLIELTCREFEHDNKDRLVLESKKKMKAGPNPKPSPDYADALALTFAIDVAPIVRGEKDNLPGLRNTNSNDYDPLDDYDSGVI